MLPELEKVIPKPLKKRYRDLFDENSAEQNVSNKIETFAFENASHIPVKESINFQLSRPNNFYRKSVIKRSITEHISIIDLEQISPELSEKDEGKFQIDCECEENKNQSRYLYLSNIVNSPIEFVGKLKVKWREQYENYQDQGLEMDELELNENKTVLDNLAFTKTNEKTRYSSCKDDSHGDNTEERNETKSKDVPVRKLERTGKGLLYQRFMASNSWNRKERNMKNTSTTHPRKRGRPKNVPDDESKRAKTANLDVDGSSVTEMRLEKKKNTNASKYAADERKNGKKTSFSGKKT